MCEQEYMVTYKDSKNSRDRKEKSIIISLDQYNESYADDRFQLLQYYPDRMVESMIYSDKVEYLTGIIREQLGKSVFVAKNEYKQLVTKVDKDYEQYEREHEKILID